MKIKKSKIKMSNRSSLNTYRFALMGPRRRLRKKSEGKVALLRTLGKLGKAMKMMSDIALLASIGFKGFEKIITVKYKNGEPVYVRRDDELPEGEIPVDMCSISIAPGGTPYNIKPIKRIWIDEVPDVEMSKEEK